MSLRKNNQLTKKLYTTLRRMGPILLEHLEGVLVLTPSIKKSLY